ncbi:hypothetical protein SNEBB_009444 [Seison nebaliae]|nr:hypothetical protein SNEBB_009444 [Seison nebaliae]
MTEGKLGRNKMESSQMELEPMFHEDFTKLLDELKFDEIIRENEELLAEKKGKLNEYKRRYGNTPATDVLEDAASTLTAVRSGLELMVKMQDMMKLNSKINIQYDMSRQKLKMMNKRMQEENSWLRSELTASQKKATETIAKNEELSSENQQLKFDMDCLKQEADTNDEWMKEVALTEEGEENEQLKKTSLELGFNDDDDNEEYDEEQNVEDNMKTSSTNSDNEVPIRLKTLHHLVIQYASKGRYEVAIPLCRQALHDLEKSTGYYHPDVATLLNILALVYRDQNKFKESSKLLIDALKIRERTLGPDHQAVAATLNNLAVLYGKRGKYVEAENLFKRAQGIWEKIM